MPPTPASLDIFKVELRVLSVLLRESSSWFQPPGVLPSNMGVDLDINVTPSWDEEAGIITTSVESELRIAAVIGATETEPEHFSEPVAKVSSTFEGITQVSPSDISKISSEYAAAYVENQGIDLVYPYLRQYLSDTVGRAGMPPIYIPHLDKSQDQDK